MDFKDQRGSVIVWIFIMVAIFAALTFAVTSSFRVGSGINTNKEKMALYLVQLNSFLEGLKVQTQVLVKINHIDETRIDFNNTFNKLADDTVTCWTDNPGCSDASCSIFQPYNPKGVQARTFPEIGYSVPQSNTGRLINGHGQPSVVAVEGVGTSAPDLIYRIAGIDPQFCNYYNAQQGITTAYTTATTMASIGETEGTSRPNNFGGCSTAATFAAGKYIGEEATIFRGKRTFCVPFDQSVMPNRLNIIYVLLAR